MSKVGWFGVWAAVVVALGLAGCGGESSASDLGVERVAEGPWGELRIAPLVIAPAPRVLSTIDLPSQPPMWVFRDVEETELAELLASVWVSDADYERTLGTLRPLGDGEGYVLAPDADAIRGLAPEGRATLYRLLAQDPANRAIMNAFRFTAADPSRWLEGWGLSPQTRALVEPLVYHNGGVLFFADAGVVFPQIADPAERLRLLGVLASEKTWRLTLHVPPDADIEALAAYWDHPRRSSSLRRLLTSLARRPGGGEIEVIHLLPPFARARLYHYPTESALLGGNDSRDCHWTAMNFYAPGQPDDRYANADEVTAALQKEYEPVDGPPRLGDLVVFTSGGELYHSAVYIAADILFTRNGTRFSRPWMFTRLADMRDFYPRLGPIEVHFFRRKQNSQ